MRENVHNEPHGVSLLVEVRIEIRLLPLEFVLDRLQDMPNRTEISAVDPQVKLEFTL